MKKHLIVLICLLLAVLSLAACGGNNDNDSESETEPGETPIAAAASVNTAELDDLQTITVSTKYCDLLFPAYWEDKVVTKINEKGHYSVTFSLEKTPCFDVIFDNTGETLLGTLKKDDAVTVISVKYYPLDEKAKDYEDCMAVVDDLNIIIKGLSKNYQFAAGELPSDNDLTDIKASFATLKYPARWKENIKVEDSGNTVSFYYLGTKLFSVVYDGKEGMELGTYDGKKLMLISEKIDEKKYSEKEMEEINTMREDINILIDHLTGDSKFVQG